MLWEISYNYYESVLNLKPVEIKYIKNSLNFVFDAFARMQTEPHY